MKFELKKEYIDRLRSELSESDFASYLNAMEDEETHGLAINMHKLNFSIIDLDYIINRFKGKLVFKNDNYAYILYNKKQLAQDFVFPGKDPLYHTGLYYIQEPSASRVLYDIDIKCDDKVLDLCASPGGKTAAILFSLKKECGGFLVSNEINFNRTKVLSSNIERLGFENVAITCSDSKKLANVFHNYFDKIIVDAPCSGEGMFRKSEEARVQWNEKLVLSLSKVQKSLISDAYNMLKVGGILIYSTCTFSKDEDEDVVDYILNLHDDLSLITMEKNYPYNSIGEGQFFSIIKKGNDMESEIKTGFDIRHLNGINVIRVGVEEFTYDHKIKIPTHASTHVDDIIFEHTVELNDEDIAIYLKGEEIRMDLPFVGYCKITYKGLGVGLAKYTNGVLKNHYPKGLRNK